MLDTFVLKRQCDVLILIIFYLFFFERFCFFLFIFFSKKPMVSFFFKRGFCCETRKSIHFICYSPFVEILCLIVAYINKGVNIKMNGITISFLKHIFNSRTSYVDIFYEDTAQYSDVKLIY